MAFKDITAGDKVGKATKARFIKAQHGTLGIEIAFKFMNKYDKDGQAVTSEEILNWIGWLTKSTDAKKGAMERTMETLVEVLGFSGDDTCDADGVLTAPDVFDWNREVQLVVDYETNPNNGKSYPRINWVNRLGGSGFAGVETAVLKNDLGALGFKAAFLAAKQKAPATPPAQQERPQQGPMSEPGFTEDDIPF